ncbi:conserved Plasmodium protein, unknown function [Plasmodium gallinaceum]|uniref:MerC domain-containing protein n=1 Tax=Plasmodium gallinaceum TaxID=5849 RepID=A0A1J1GNZ9_PLAGA|nr:conserved Plasmodium protein, unknown function [Plasmodium gallinaceum]CRG93007.1 conserved Plasmodium protein, unknown function [Plasmodium gallinaceum]
MIKITKLSLNRISSIASIICLIDCTLIPILMFTLSIFNIVDYEIVYFNHLSDILALFVMAPICSLCIIFNYYQLKNVLLLLWGVFGIILFTISHGHFSINEKINIFLQKFHIIISLFSILILLSNNYVSQKILKKNNLDNCCFTKNNEKNENGQKYAYHINVNCSNLSSDYNKSSLNYENKNYKKFDKTENELVSFLH